MKSLEDMRARWDATQRHSNSVTGLRRSVRYNGSSSPCVSGCRSVCWKAFLLSDSGDAAAESWAQALRDGRHDYSERMNHYLKFIYHPEALAELTTDPLADDPNSPWNTVRQDEIVRSEIQQDVQRLPDEANYHEARIQTMILDILFIYCKTNPSRGGYRQGMHELLAPILYVMEQDAIDRTATGDVRPTDESMLEMLDSSFIQHDAYVVFSKLMEHAQAFYVVRDAAAESAQAPLLPQGQDQSSAIVERSKFIHEVCLQKVDPELAAHLTSIEILPQIFLIRWVRLLFSREFPFDQFLVLWDTMFGLDPTLELIDLVCVAMLIRIRWQLLEADYSVCLQLLLRYPPPAAAHGPHTFVDDAMYLRNHLNTAGGSTLIMKYTGRMPNLPKPTDGSRPTTPSFSRFSSFRSRGMGGRSPMQQQGGVEALFQGAAKGAKGVLERGEKLGINQAVRDAVGEIRRNMSGFNEARYVSRSPRDVLADEGAARALAVMEKRSKQLSSMLEETVNSLKALSGSNLDDKAKSLEVIEVAAAKIQFVKIYLEDSSMEFPDMGTPTTDEPPLDEEKEAGEHTPDAQAETHVVPGSVDDVHISGLNLADDEPPSKQVEVLPSPNPDAMDTAGDEAQPSAPNARVDALTRPPAPIPTRSTLAQSTFSWMLEPDETTPTKPSSSTPVKSSPPQHRKRTSNNASRERNAFLFGEVIVEKEGRDPLETDEIFGLEPIRKAKEP